ncbi:MAG TPA: 4Fe-4S dicluster domain-containing protein [candidate division Zixibacteria bacterium]|nr:4Fe-4S dicluster domain-containing protein [candidate division Zixibacteria bacterium]
MSPQTRKTKDKLIIERDDLPKLLEAIKSEGYSVVGPTVRDRAIVLDEINALESLPVGWSDSQEPASYKLESSGSKALFDFNVGGQSWKRYLFPPRQQINRMKRTKTGFEVDRAEAISAKLAFFGVRPCELAAIKTQDKIFMQGEFVDPLYKRTRDQVLIAVINCTRAGGTCFCASMGTGPMASDGYDLALTEIYSKTSHYFIASAGTEAGRKLLDCLPQVKATEEQLKTESLKLTETSAQMGRSLDTTDMKELLYRNVDNRRWDQVGRRCLTCANCTMVCPTCFCATVEDLTDLSGSTAERVRRWDSCFTMEYSYIHGGSVRPSAKARYRQWMTHKLASWIDQFGTPGCVGCGRCITWCPVGIDITEELRAIRETDAGQAKGSESMEVQNANA